MGRVSITPPLSAPHASWGAQVHVFPDGVETDLWATVLVVTDGVTMAAFVDLDLVIVSRAESDAIRAAVGKVLNIPLVAGALFGDAQPRRATAERVGLDRGRGCPS